MVPVLFEALTHAILITGFVAMMMIAVEYVSILSQGTFQAALRGSPWIQYLVAVLLGAIPGCLGPFTVVTLYVHKALPLGAVVGAMIATSGDEAFVMLGLFPATALWLTVGLAAVGLVVGPVVDILLKSRRPQEHCAELIVHPEDACRCFPGKEILEHWRFPRPARVTLTLAAVFSTLAVATGLLGPGSWNWVRITLVALGAFGAFVVVTVPDHFLSEHLWRHVALRHVPRIFVWTFGVLAAVGILNELLDLATIIRGNQWGVLVAAVLLGIVPESGPHLVFVTLFDEGTIPFSILAASSIVQDGHGMLPLLAESKGDFFRVKAINVVVGLLLGAVLLAAGA